MNNTIDHKHLINEILITGGSLPNIRLWIRNVGLATPLYRTHPLFFGIEGESDIQGIIAPHGRMISIEVKTGAGKLTLDQERWRDMMIKFGALYIEARSLDQVMKELKSC